MQAFARWLAGVVMVAGMSAAQQDDPGSWSASVRDLQIRIDLVEKAKVNGTRSLVPYLELRNAGDSAAPFRVRCGRGHVTFELVDAAGKVVRDGALLPRSGIHPDPGTIVLPFDSSMRIGMYCSNWGVPREAAAMISTDSGAWVLQPEEQGKVFLRATVHGERVEADSSGTWWGTIQTHPLKVEWSD